MVREHLSPELKEAGLELLKETDRLAMNVQGAMWIYSYAMEDWRYYLVTSIIDSASRRKAYQLLIEAFKIGDFPKDMTVDDIHLGSPSDEYFQLVSKIVRVDDGIVEFSNCLLNDMPFDGVIYRSVRSQPDARAAKAIQRGFEKSIGRPNLYKINA